MKRFTVMDRAATSASGSRYSGSIYRRIGVVEVDTDILAELGRTEPSAITDRATGVVRVVRTWESLYVGTTPDCAFGRAYDAATRHAACMNHTWYADNPDQLEHDTVVTLETAVARHWARLPGPGEIVPGWQLTAEARRSSRCLPALEYMRKYRYTDDAFCTSGWLERIPVWRDQIDARGPA